MRSNPTSPPPASTLTGRCHQLCFKADVHCNRRCPHRPVRLGSPRPTPARLSPARDISLNASQDITGGGSINAARNGSFVAGRDINFDVAGTLTVGTHHRQHQSDRHPRHPWRQPHLRSRTLLAPRGISTGSGTITVAAGIAFTAGNTTDDGAINSSAGTVHLTATHANHRCAIAGHSGVTFTSANNNTSTSGNVISITGAVSASAGPVSITGYTIGVALRRSPVPPSLAAAQDVNADSELTSSTGDTTITATSSISLTDLAGISSAANVALTAAPTSPAVGQAITATGTITLGAGNDIAWDAAGVIQTAGNVQLTAGNALTDDAIDEHCWHRPPPPPPLH